MNEEYYRNYYKTKQVIKICKQITKLIIICEKMDITIDNDNEMNQYNEINKKYNNIRSYNNFDNEKSIANDLKTVKNIKKLLLKVLIE